MISQPRYHKRNRGKASPLVSIILLDWSVRDHFQALEWLSRQDVPRDTYELIWIELYDRVVPAVMEKSDVVITMGQKGMYHKHIGYNVGLLEARGKVITVCDSDAVFQPDFVDSIVKFFGLDENENPASAVLMHYEWRTASTYPDGLTGLDELSRYKWFDLWPNVGACMSVAREDAIRFGGFDEHKSYRGYLCGPYELGWRMVNAGLPEVWHDESVALWHFAHPDPTATYVRSFSSKRWKEIRGPHIDHHALNAVEAFSTGRLLPLQENPEIHRLRMSWRKVGSTFEEKYALFTSPSGFSRRQKMKLYAVLAIEPFSYIVNIYAIRFLTKILGKRGCNVLKGWWNSFKSPKVGQVQ